VAVPVEIAGNEAGRGVCDVVVDGGLERPVAVSDEHSHERVRNDGHVDDAVSGEVRQEDRCRRDAGHDLGGGCELSVPQRQEDEQRAGALLRDDVVPAVAVHVADRDAIDLQLRNGGHHRIERSVPAPGEDLDLVSEIVETDEVELPVAVEVTGLQRDPEFGPDLDAVGERAIGVSRVEKSALPEITTSGTESLLKRPASP
jgi:hypothetical protein